MNQGTSKIKKRRGRAGLIALVRLKLPLPSNWLVKTGFQFVRGKAISEAPDFTNPMPGYESEFYVSPFGSNLEFAAAMLVFYDEHQLVTSLLQS